jgi:hypothetical protein
MNTGPSSTSRSGPAPSNAHAHSHPWAPDSGAAKSISARVSVTHSRPSGPESQVLGTFHSGGEVVDTPVTGDDPLGRTTGRVDDVRAPVADRGERNPSVGQPDRSFGESEIVREHIDVNGGLFLVDSFC